MKTKSSIFYIITTCYICFHANTIQANIIQGTYNNNTPRNVSTAPTYRSNVDYTPGSPVSGSSSFSGPYGGSVTTSYQDGTGTITVTAPSNAANAQNGSKSYNFTYQESAPTGTFSINGNTIETPYGNYYTIPSNPNLIYDPSTGTLTDGTYDQTIVFYGPNSSKSSPGSLVIVDQTTGATIGEVTHTPGEITYTSEQNTTTPSKTLYYTMGTVTGSDGNTYNAVAYTTSAGTQGIILVDPNTGFIRESNQTTTQETNDNLAIYNGQTGRTFSYSDDFIPTGQQIYTEWMIKNSYSPRHFTTGYSSGVNGFTAVSDQGSAFSANKDYEDELYVQGTLRREENPYIQSSQYAGGQLQFDATDQSQPSNGTFIMDGQLYYDEPGQSSEVGSYTRTYSLSSGSSPSLTVNTDITSNYNPNTTYDLTTQYTPGTGSTSYTTQFGNTVTLPTGRTINVSDATGNSVSWTNNAGTISYDYTYDGNTSSGTANITRSPNEGITITGTNNSLSFINGVFYYNGEPFYYDPATQSLVGYYGNSIKVGQ